MQQDESTVTSETTEAEHDEDETVQLEVPTPIAKAKAEDKDFDWLALGIVIIIAALFALAGRFNAQPATSLAPVAVLSATGCGLLVTGMRKLRTPIRPGLFEAALGGLFLALFQFIAALSYPHVLQVLSEAADERLGFFTTWGLITAFSVIFSIVGATLGHLAFAPLRPLPAKKGAPQRSPASDDDEDEKAENTLAAVPPEETTPKRSLVSYFITVLLLGLAPVAVGYVFSAAFDYMLTTYQFFPGPYPTLRLLSTLLPWQLPVAFTINSSDPNSLVFLLWQLWRFPVFLGNPTMFDVQALEPFVFNSAALGLLLLTMRGTATGAGSQRIVLGWPSYLMLQFALGLLLVFPADLWIVRGLQGLLQNPVIAVPIRTLTILDQSTFILNLVTGPLICLGIGLLLRFSRIERIRVQ
ncbi:MAG: hypothetical protein ACR2H5_14250 [Ktedonobacteraceae bacterium]